MKKRGNCLRILTFVSLGILLAGSASALTYTTPLSHLNDTTNYVDLDGPSPYTPNTGTLNSRTLNPNSVTFNITLDPGSGPKDWKDIQIGDGFDHPSDNSGLATGFANMGSDFSAYDTYSLVIKNPNDNGPWFMAQLYMNTGWTDIGETDVFYWTDWQWISPGSTSTLSLDLGSVSNLNHVSNVGFKIGANVTGDDSWNPYNWADPFNVEVSSIPEPTSLLLLGSGLVGIIGLRQWRK